MESFQISLQPGCRTSTANGAFAKGRIRQGRRRLRPDCECKGTAKYSHTQEKHMKKFENSPLYRGFWGVQIAKHRKTAQITPFYPPERAWGFHGRWCRSVEPEGMDRIQDTLIL